MQSDSIHKLSKVMFLSLGLLSNFQAINLFIKLITSVLVSKYEVESTIELTENPKNIKASYLCKIYYQLFGQINPSYANI